MEHFDKQNIERCIRRLSDIKNEAFEIKVFLSEIRNRVSDNADEYDLLVQPVNFLTSIILDANESIKDLSKVIK